ncbi:GSCOCG00009097001-RA-CDS [Cotesia congregata]|uniref:Similar to tbrg1: Transforming growth factor beta regulator 1 (Xenopus tropicalis) n=1 Tax=Cotesia congregata TaxID=51543 RepID=A0A8J2MDE7_COTCN|nr:GSCOCG00009097001-RA-CDS [Cotesia congregata]CAG5083098.1 Similar to tbrg1: Transforming growth factor beta regulator 1 (Xenopus tropicalis) [Cotesia congregata]
MDYKNFNKIDSESEDNIIYNKKYKKLKRLVKDLVFENAALCDQVAQTQENLVIVKEERLYLLKKLTQFQGESSDGPLPGKMNNLNASMSCEGVTKKSKKRNSIDAGETSGKKAKRCKPGSRRVVQLIPLDINGRPLFPISLGDLTVYSLGEIVTDRLGYHTDEFIYPVGFCSTRLYASLKNIQSPSLYTCKIVDGGAKPRFEIVSDTDLDQPLVGSTPDECHSRLLQALSPLLMNITPKGASFFGISHPTIQNLIQSSPGTRKLPLYKPQKFEVSKNSIENGSSPIPDEELDPSVNFSSLHRSFKLNYSIKEEPSDHDLRALKDL